MTYTYIWQRAGQRSRYSDWLRAGRSVDQTPVGERFSAAVQTVHGAHPASCTMGTGYFPGVKSGRGVTLTPHPFLLPWSWKSRAITLLPLWTVWPVQSFSACTRVHFTFSLHLIRLSLIPRRVSDMVYLLTPCSRALLQKLTGSQAVKNCPAFYEIRRFITAFTSASHLSLSWARSIQSRSKYNNEIHKQYISNYRINTLRTGDADLRFYVTTEQDGRRRFAFLTRWNSVHLQFLLSATPQGGMFPQVSHLQALLGSLASISWKYQFTKIVSEFVINF